MTYGKKKADRATDFKSGQGDQIVLDEDEVNAVLDAVWWQIADMEHTLRWMGKDNTPPIIRERLQFLSDLDMSIREQAFNKPECRTQFPTEQLMQGTASPIAGHDLWTIDD